MSTLFTLGLLIMPQHTSLVAKGSVVAVQKIYDLDLEQSNPSFHNIYIIILVIMTYRQTKCGCKKISSSYSKKGHILNFGCMTPHCDHDLEDSIAIFSHNALAHYRHHHAKCREKASTVLHLLIFKIVFNLCIDLEYSNPILGYM